MKIIETIVNSPGHLAFFAGLDAAGVKKKYRDVAKEIHPDVCSHPDAQGALVKLNVMYGEAEARITAGEWSVDGMPVSTYTGSGGKTFKFSYFSKKNAGEETYFTTQHGVVITGPAGAAADFAEGAKISQGFSKTYPLGHALRGLSEKYVLDFYAVESPTAAVGKCKVGENAVLLSDAIAVNGPLSPKTAAWVVSSLLDACCLFEHSRVAHVGINPNTVAIYPSEHVAVPVAWQFARGVGREIRRVPVFTVDAAPSVKKHKKAASSIQLACVKKIFSRATAGRTDVPTSMKVWAAVLPKSSAQAEYAAWEKARDASYPRKFHPCEFTAGGVRAALLEREQRRD